MRAAENNALIIWHDVSNARIGRAFNVAACDNVPQRKAVFKEQRALFRKGLRNFAFKERRKQIAGTLSGGEQQMLAMGRALMSKPKLLMLDEPSMGLAPILVEQIFDIIRELHAAGTTILLVEQNAQAALSVADRAYVLETGRITLSGTGKELMASDAVRKAYLGG